MMLTEKSRPKVGIPITDTNDGGVLWEFPNGVTGRVSKEYATYLCLIGMGMINPRSDNVEFSTL